MINFKFYLFLGLYLGGRFILVYDHVKMSLIGLLASLQSRQTKIILNMKTNNISIHISKE